MSGKKILVVEDDEDILELISYNLQKVGLDVARAPSGEDALRQVRDALPDMILLDLMLPGMNGLDVCRRLRSDNRTKQVPVIMVTAKGGEADVIAGFELGADDYVTKPFRPKELIARVKAVLKRSARSTAAGSDDTLRVHNIEIQPGRREVRVDGRLVDLTYTEFQVLHTLARRPGWVLTRYQIVDAVRGEDYSVTDRAVDVQIVGLRKKLGRAGRFVETVRGIGYRIRDAE